MKAIQIARYLEIASKQRERLAKDLDAKMGAGAGAQAAQEAAEIATFVLSCKVNPTWDVQLVSDVTTQPENAPQPQAAPQTKNK